MVTRTIPITRSCCDPDCLSTVAQTRFDEGEIAQRAARLSALGDEIRLKMIRLLAQHDALCVCELQGAFEIAQPTISHHLRILRDAGLVDVERRGIWAYYSIRRDALKEVIQELVSAV